MGLFDRSGKKAKLSEADSASSPEAATGEPSDKQETGLLGRFRRGLKRTSDLLQTDIRDLFKQEGQLVDDALLGSALCPDDPHRHGFRPRRQDSRRDSTGVSGSGCRDGRRARPRQSQTAGADGSGGSPAAAGRRRPNRDSDRRRQWIRQDHFHREVGRVCFASRVARSCSAQPTPFAPPPSSS